METHPAISLWKVGSPRCRSSFKRKLQSRKGILISYTSFRSEALKRSDLLCLLIWNRLTWVAVLRHMQGQPKLPRSRATITDTLLSVLMHRRLQSRRRIILDLLCILLEIPLLHVYYLQIFMKEFDAEAKQRPHGSSRQNPSVLPTFVSICFQQKLAETICFLPEILLRATRVSVSHPSLQKLSITWSINQQL